MKESTQAMILTSFNTWVNERMGMEINKTQEENELSSGFEILDTKLTAKEFLNFEEKMLNYVESQNKIAYAAGFEACFKMIMDLR